MVINEPVDTVRNTATAHRMPPIVGDGNFETRWAAWMARGRVHEQRVRRRFVVSAGVIAIAGAIAFALFG